MLQRDKLREADLFTSVILAVLGAAVIAGAIRMPMSGTYGGMPITWYTSPGFFPLLLGILLVVGAITVFVRGCREGALQRLVGRAKTFVTGLPRNRIAWRMVTIWGLLAAYAGCLAGHPFAGFARWLEPISNSPLTAFLAQPEGANYVLSSCLFLALFMVRFYYWEQDRRRVIHLAMLLLLSLVVSWGVGYGFTQHLYSPLPW